MEPARESDEFELDILPDSREVLFAFQTLPAVKTHRRGIATMPSQKRFLIVTEDPNGRVTQQTTTDEPDVAEEYAARSVATGVDGYTVAHIYERIKSCRAPAPKVEWAKEPHHKALAAPKK